MESELLEHPLDAPSAFTPEALVDAVRRSRNLADTPVPAVCVLDFDGDLTDWLIRHGHATRFESWACFHTHLYIVESDGARCGIIARTIGGPYAVLIAEQLRISGARLILGLTSAGRVSPALPLPSLVIATRAIRDEGTSYHYLAPARYVECPTPVGGFLSEELSELGLAVVQGTVWTTDAPYRETAAQLQRYAATGVLAVEMQAASLFAFASACGVGVGVVAQVTNAIEHQDEQFDKGSEEENFTLLRAMVRAGLRYLGT